MTDGSWFFLGMTCASLLIFVGGYLMRKHAERSIRGCHDVYGKCEKHPWGSPGEEEGSDR